MLRFAPSPTKDMDIEHLRVALFNFILSKQLNEDLLIRIDDTDKQNNIEGKDKEILELLALFSIDYKGAIYQSDNLKYHQKMAMQLMAQKKAFSCFCSDEKLKELEQEARKKRKPFEYDGFCSTLSDETVLNCNAPFTVRMQKPLENIVFEDKLLGEKEYVPSKVDAFFILNHDKSPTYNYACAVDDMLYNISTVLRTNENLDDTPRQIHIRQNLGYDKALNYIHLPSIKMNAGQNSSVKWFIDEGFLPSAIANYLVLLGNTTPKEIFTLEEAVEWFDIQKISLEELTFDIEALRAINKQHLSSMNEMRLSKILGFADTDIGKLAKLFLEEASTIKEIKEKLDLIFSSKDLESNNETKEIASTLKKAPFFNDFEDLKAYIIKETQISEDKLIEPLTYLIMGRIDGPKIAEVYPFIKNYLGEIV